MGFRFRKSVKAGPFRMTFSKSGVGYSVGGKGFRVTKKAKGGIRTTASVPGTGISYVKDYSLKRQAKPKTNAKDRRNSSLGNTLANHNYYASPSNSADEIKKKNIAGIILATIAILCFIAIIIIALIT